MLRRAWSAAATNRAPEKNDKTLQHLRKRERDATRSSPPAQGGSGPNALMLPLPLFGFGAGHSGRLADLGHIFADLAPAALAVTVAVLAIHWVIRALRGAKTI